MNKGHFENNIKYSFYIVIVLLCILFCKKKLYANNENDKSELNKYFSSGIFDEMDLDIEKRYCFDNLEFFYQYDLFKKSFYENKYVKNYKDNEKFFSDLIGKSCIVGDYNVLKIKTHLSIKSNNVYSYGEKTLDEQLDLIENINFNKYENAIFMNKHICKYMLDAVDIINKYDRIIKKIHENNPNCNIYICPLFYANAEDENQSEYESLYSDIDSINHIKNYYKNNFIDLTPFIDNVFFIHNVINVDNDVYYAIYQYTLFYVNFMKIKNNNFLKSEHISYADIEDKNRKCLYMTFDDGPSQYTVRLMRILQKYNIKATFFVTNQYPKYINVLKELKKEGHTIGVHTFTHNYSIYRSKEKYFDDLYKMQCKVREYTGEFSKLIRFPGGSSNSASKKYNKNIMKELTTLVQDMGYVYYDWNVTSGDSALRINEGIILNNVIDGVSANKNRSVILFHDTKITTINTIDDFINYAIGNGYEFKSLNEYSIICHHPLKK